MSRFVRLTLSDARRVPWKNGRGVTQEIALGPPGASFQTGDFDWRVSRAAVVEDGPFSSFPGIDRVLVVTDGAGLSVSHGADSPAATVLPLEPHRFSGDVPTTGVLLAGPVGDFNVLTRRGRRRAQVRVRRPGREALREAMPPGDALVYVLEGRVLVRAGGTGADAAAGGWLEPGETLHAAEVESPGWLELAAQVSSIAIVVTLEAEGGATDVP